MKTITTKLLGPLALTIAILGWTPRVSATTEATAATRDTSSETMKPAYNYCGDGQTCDDNDPCTVDSCLNGACQHTPKTCDDGNSCTIDSCDAMTGACHNDPDPRCNVPPPPAPRCGDGNIDANETCDDGNLTDGDGCDHTCHLEPKPTPPPPPPPAPTPTPTPAPTPNPAPDNPPVTDNPAPIVHKNNVPVCYRWNYDDKVTCFDGKEFILDDAHPSTSVGKVPDAEYNFAIAVQNYERDNSDKNYTTMVNTGVADINEALASSNPAFSLDTAAPSDTQDSIPHLKLMGTDINAIKSMVTFDKDQLSNTGTLPAALLMTTNTNKHIVVTLHEEAQSGGCNSGTAQASLIPGHQKAVPFGIFVVGIAVLIFYRARRFSL